MKTTIRHLLLVTSFTLSSLQIGFGQEGFGFSNPSHDGGSGSPDEEVAWGSSDHSETDPPLGYSGPTYEMPRDPFVPDGEFIEPETEGYGYVRPSYQRQPRLGFRGRMLYGGGLLIEALQPGGQAEQLGIEVGDIITHIGPRRSNMIEIQSFDHYRSLLRKAVRYNGGRMVVRLQNGNMWSSSPVVYLPVRLGSSRSFYGDMGP